MSLVIGQSYQNVDAIAIAKAKSKKAAASTAEGTADALHSFKQPSKPGTHSTCLPCRS